VETHELDGVSVSVYSPEKTLADCFKFRNKAGLDTAVEAVRFYRERRSVNVDALIRYAEICRVDHTQSRALLNCSPEDLDPLLTLSS
jgi:hypothetical protein